MDTEAEKAHFVTKLETHHLLILTPIPQLKGNLDKKILFDETLSPRCIEVYVIWSIVGLEESPSFLLEYLQTTYYILYQKYSLHYIYIHKFCFWQRIVFIICMMQIALLCFSYFFLVVVLVPVLVDGRW